MLGSNWFLNMLLQSLERQFPSVQALDRKQTAKAIGIGLLALDLRIKGGRNLPRYIGYVLINAKPPIHKFDKAMIIQVAKIGNNINQIAKHVNIDKVIDGVVLKQIIDINKKISVLMFQKQNPRS